MPMCNLLENSQNYSMTSDSLCNYYRDKIRAGEFIGNKLADKIVKPKHLIQEMVKK